MPTKVSVVIPVFNPGPYIEPCIESLLAQTMSTDDLELVFVNDGSTDDSLERLQRYGCEHSHVKIISIPNSGWPGKPRNVGMDAACGEYVMFVDQDDQMDAEALERMYGLGSENGADVVLGKVTSNFRAVNHKLYRTQRPRCSVYTAPLLNSLTPHKMLRAEFLREQAIRYPEGKRRLEDQPFIVKAYFAAANVSIVADYVCYRYLRRPDDGNASSVQIDPVGYYGNVAEVLDVIDAHTEPGPDRDRFYRRFLRIEILKRLGSAPRMQATDEYRTSLLHAIRSLVEQRFSPSVDAGLGTAERPLARLARSGTIEQIAAQADAVRSIRCEPVSTAVRATTDGFEVDVEVRLTQHGGPLRLDRDDSASWRLPAAVIGGDPAFDDLRVAPAVKMPGDVIVRHRESRDEWFLLEPLTARLEVSGDFAEVIWSGTVRLPLDQVAGGRSVRTGLHDLYIRVEAFGLGRDAKLDGRAMLQAAMVHVDAQGRITRLYRSAQHTLALNVGAPTHRLEEALRRTTVSWGPELTVLADLDVVWQRPPSRMTLRIGRGAGQRALTLRLKPDGSPTRWQASLGDQATTLAEGSHKVVLRFTDQSPTPRVVRLDPIVIQSALREAWRSQIRARRRRRAVARVRRALRRMLRRPQ